MELHVGLQVQILTEGETAQVITFRNVAQLQIFLFQAHHGRAGEYNLQIGKAVVAQAQLLAPVGVLEHLVYQQYLPAAALEFVSEVHQAVTGEVEVVHVVKRLGAVGTDFSLAYCSEECGLAYASGAFDTDKTVVPVNLIHEVAGERGHLYALPDKRVFGKMLPCFKFGLSGDKYTPFL